MDALVNPTSVYLYCAFVDFRKSINGLMILVEQELQRNVFEPGLFVFCNKGRDKLKVLYWDRTGFALWYKRLERDKFKWPTVLSKKELSLSAEQFQWLLHGYDVVGHQRIHYRSVG